MTDLPIHYRAARKPLLVFGVLAFGMTVIVCGLVGWLTGRPAALFFGACTVVIFYRALSSAAVVSLKPEGVVPWRYPPLAWDEIDFAEAVQSSGEVFLVIHAKDHDGYIQGFTFFKRKWAQMNAKLMQGSVYLSRSLFQVPVADVAKAINVELARWRSGNT